jgi:hypothetical protein
VSQDPFDELRERLILAAGGRPKTTRTGAIVLAALALLLTGGAVAAFALTRDEEKKPVAGATPTPTPSPAVTPTPSLPPIVTAQPTRTPAPNRRPPSTRRPGSPAIPPTPTPVPEYDIDFQPDLSAGVAGWCVSVTIRTPQLVTGGRDCTPAGPPGTHLIASGGVFGTPGMMYAVVDRVVQHVRLSGGRRIEPRRDRSLPANWRIATWEADTTAGATPQSFSLHDAAGRDVSATAATGPPGRLQTRRVSPRRPPKAPCAITARSGPRPVSARLVVTPRPLDLVRPTYLSCAQTTYRMSGETFRAAVLLNARDLQALAAPLPSTAALAVRRAGSGWLVVSGGNATQRKRLLKALRVRKP